MLFRLSARAPRPALRPGAPLRLQSTALADENQPQYLPSPYGDGGGVRLSSPTYPAPAHGPIKNAEDYIDSLRKRGLLVYVMGEKIDEFVDHPIVKPSINAMAESYRLAEAARDIATEISPLIGGRVHRFTHVCGSADDVVAQNTMQRRLGQITGTCFQRCVGQDAINSAWTVTHMMDKSHGTQYHRRFQDFVSHVQAYNLVVGGAMTDPKGDRSKPPHQQEDADLFVRVVDRRDGGVVLRGAKVHQTGTLNSHWMVVMPGQRLSEADSDYAVVAAVPIDAAGLTFVLGRQSCDSRSLESSGVDVGNAKYGGQEVTVIFDDVWVPNERVFMDGESQYAADLVERFTAYHRRSYVCKSGLGDVLIGAAAELADMNGVMKASHIKDKLVEMTHLNETIWGMGFAASKAAKPTDAGNYEPDVMLANVCKHHVTRFPYEIARLAQDLAGGAMVTMPSDDDFNHPEIGEKLTKYMANKPGVDVKERRRVLRLVENLTMGRNAVGYLTESMHGAGSPAAQRVVIQKLAKMEEKRGFARRLAGCAGCSGCDDDLKK